MTHNRETIKFSDRIMECLHVTYKKIFYKQAKMLSVSFWTTSPMNWLRATGTRKQYCIEENRTRPLCQWQVLGNSGHQRRRNYQGEILGIFVLDAWKNPKAATKKRGPKKSGEPQTHRGPRGDWESASSFPSPGHSIGITRVAPSLLLEALPLISLWQVNHLWRLVQRYWGKEREKQLAWGWVFISITSHWKIIFRFIIFRNILKIIRKR